MKAIHKLLAGWLLAILLAVPLFAASPVHTTQALGWGSIAVLFLAGIGFLVFGAVTVTYEWPVVGTVPPTVAQMKPLSLVTAILNFSADADTLALITHNMQVGSVILPTNPGSIVNELAALFPLASWYYTAGGSINTLLSGSLVSSSVFQITKASAASSAGTINVFVLRPWTGIR